MRAERTHVEQFPTSLSLLGLISCWVSSYGVQTMPGLGPRRHAGSFTFYHADTSAVAVLPPCTLALWRISRWPSAGRSRTSLHMCLLDRYPLASRDGRSPLHHFCRLLMAYFGMLVAIAPDGVRRAWALNCSGHLWHYRHHGALLRGHAQGLFARSA